jgi:hypothetical protein
MEKAVELKNEYRKVVGFIGFIGMPIPDHCKRSLAPGISRPTGPSALE